MNSVELFRCAGRLVASRRDTRARIRHFSVEKSKWQVVRGLLAVYSRPADKNFGINGTRDYSRVDTRF